MVTVGSILGDTFRFVRANLPSIAVWGAINLLMSIGMRVAMAPIYRAQAAAIASGVPPQISSGPFILTMLVTMVVMLILYAAVFRAVLFPDDSAAFYLRLGWDEARLLGLMLLLWLCATIAMIILILVMSIVGFGFGMALGRQAAVPLGIAAVVVLWALTIFVATRLSVAGPLTILRRKIVIGPAWRLTHGKFWTLFGTYFVLGLVGIAITLIFMWPMVSQMFATMGRPGDPEATARLMALQADQMSLTPTPGHILTLLVGSFGGAFALAFFGGVPAMATLQLVEERDYAARD